MLDRFKVPDEDKIYVPVDKITEVTQNILKASGVSEEGAKNSTSVLIGNDPVSYTHLTLPTNREV